MGSQPENDSPDYWICLGFCYLPVACKAYDQAHEQPVEPSCSQEHFIALKAQPRTDSDYAQNPKTGTEITVKDVIADAFLQQILTRPAEYSVIATLNLNGDYISDALAAQVGGIGMAPGANLSDQVALFEATHGTAPKYAGKDQVNPSSLILSAEMMLRHLGWNAAADLIVNGLSGAIAAKTVTYDLERLMQGASKLSCSAFGQAIIAHMR